MNPFSVPAGVIGRPVGLPAAYRDDIRARLGLRSIAQCQAIATQFAASVGIRQPNAKRGSVHAMGWAVPYNTQTRNHVSHESMFGDLKFFEIIRPGAFSSFDGVHLTLHHKHGRYEGSAASVGSRNLRLYDGPEGLAFAADLRPGSESAAIQREYESGRVRSCSIEYRRTAAHWSGSRHDGTLTLITTKAELDSIALLVDPDRPAFPGTEVFLED